MTAEDQVGRQTEEALAVVAQPLAPDGPLVGILVASARDRKRMDEAKKLLDEAEVPCEVRVVNPHREPDELAQYCRTARSRGLRVLIAGAGLNAALPGLAASHTDLPVIGVPLTGPGSAAGGLDALLGVAQMPAGVPVACVGVDNARNAAHLAVRILGA